jgi:hypothetical protein
MFLVLPDLAFGLLIVFVIGGLDGALWVTRSKNIEVFHTP